MAANRYGQIWHGDHHHINIRFPSNEARLKFQSEFEAYHASHDHDGDIPTFKCVTTKDLKLSTGSRSPQDLVKAESDKDYRITIDGYSWDEIHDYHNPSGYRDYSWYRVPTCCVPPTIVIDREFVDSGTLQRHPLSAIFGDMQKDEFDALVKSVQTDGFIEPVIRIYEGKILDGWHRYRAAKELNLIRKLKFQEWDERGDPKAFVLARNIERRHLNPSQRAQIAVAFNERFGHGTNRFTVESPRGEPKTRQELAREAGVGTSTIDRAIAVEKAGRSDEVIAGKRTATEVIAEEKSKSEGMPLVGVYFLKSEHSGRIKIGFSRQLPRRIDEIKGASPEPVELLHVIPDASPDLESALHDKFQNLRIGGEWFEGSQDLLEYVDSLKTRGSEAVIADEKTAGEVLGEQQAKSDNEREAAIAVVEPRFLQAVEKWRSSHVERLQKFERLPVGRTPLLESEYIKTYFELADPRIPQNTKPTAAHYEGAIECMQDRPVAFAEQLEGRHYRRIIKDWDESVLPQLIKRFQGPLLGYSTSQLKETEAFEVRIKRAIRRQYAFQGRIPSQPFEVLFEITEDAHAVLIQLNPKEWVRDGREISWAVSVLPEPIDTPAEAEEIAGEKSAGEVVSEETVKGLWGLVTAEMKAWKARDKEKCRFPSDHIGKASKSMLITALRKYEERDDEGAATETRELRDLLRLMKTDSFAFILCVRTVLSDTLKTEIELESAHGTAEDDRRRVWIAFGESDISNAISKEAFALAAAKQHDLYEDSYGSGENYLLGRDYAPIDKLNLKEAQQISAFFNSVEAAIKARPDWIQVLMPTEQAPASDGRASAGFQPADGNGSVHRQRNEQNPRPSAEEVSPMDPVWDAFNERHPKWKAWYAESGYKENELIQASTESELLDALRVYRESDREGMPTADEVKDMTNLMKQKSYPLAVYLRNLLRERGVSDTPALPADEDEAEQDPFHDVDLEAVKADLEALLKKVMPVEKHPLWHQICEDIIDAYLDYENLPNDREIFAILLDCALTAIDELT